MADTTSPRFSLAGWNAWEWFKGNWTTIREGGKVFVPAVLGWLATKDPMWTFLVTVGGKFVLDVLNYFVNEQTIDK